MKVLLGTYEERTHSFLKFDIFLNYYILPSLQRRSSLMSKYSEKDCSRDTGDSTSTVNRAWHDARSDAAGSGHLPERNSSKVSDSANGGILHGIFTAIGLTGNNKR
jgi:hypothetical protein